MDQDAMGVNLLDLPDELIVNILRFLDCPRDVLNAGLACKTLNSCADDNSIWYGLTSRYQFWAIDLRPSHRWKSEIKRRFEWDRKIDHAVEGLIENPWNHILPKFRIVVKMEREAKDRLLFHRRTQDELGRKYWADKLLGACQRPPAVDSIANTLRGEELPPEDVLVALDMLALDDVDLQWARNEFDRLADEFKQGELEYHRLVLFVTSQFHPARPNHLSDHFITRTLRDLHGSEIVLMVIIAALASRLGLESKLVIRKGLEIEHNGLIYGLNGPSHGLAQPLNMASLLELQRTALRANLHREAPTPENDVCDLDVLKATAWTMTVLPVEDRLRHLFKSVPLWDKPLATLFVVSLGALPGRAQKRLMQVEDDDQQQTPPAMYQGKIKAGFCVQHGRYGNMGFVAGDSTDEEFNSPPGLLKRFHSFYDELGARRWVLEENLERVYECSTRLKYMAGRFFRRWDEELKMFVNTKASNG